MRRTLPASTPTPRPRRLGLATRSRTDRVLAGLAGGIGERLGIDPVVVRLAFVVLAFAGGFGVLLYLFGWLIGSEAPEGAEPRPLPGTETGIRQIVSVALVIAGMLLLLRTAGLWFGNAVVWPVALAAFGSAVIWTRTDESGRARWLRFATNLSGRPGDALDPSRPSRGRIAAGALLVLGGMIAFLAANTSLSALRNLIFAVLVSVTGLGLILGPWMWQLGRQLAVERRERIRSEERSEVAAHLHDSVLQTLALIQRSSSPEEMATLARSQERELRTWLYSRNGRVSTTGPAQTLGAAFDAMAGRVERMHHVPVDVVTVGDSRLDERLRALVEAAGEAMSNAARHSGAGLVSVYVEAAPDAVSAYVRDEGIGFETGNLQPDRGGIAQSIVGRMERNGGLATVTSKPAEGTEVHLRMPRMPRRPA
jgi:signal transduction histidine kinase/phage shock protein PspC (stress-responsive transcriptional regulator)